MTNERGCELTEMEGLALGLVKTLEPVSAYKLAAAFAESPSAFWSGSAGAVYPMVQRLHKAKLLAGRKSQRGRREITLYTLTKEGERAFRAWLLDVERAINPGFDPLRSRLSMLHMAPPKARAAFIENAQSRMEDQLDIELPGGPAKEDFRRFHRSWLRHRIRWVYDLKKTMLGG